MKTVFDFSDYKAYLSHYLDAQKAKGHGFRSKIARALNCQVAYVSQVLNRGAHFSLEQAEELNEFLGHDKEESEYFILLVQMNRAGTKKLKARFEDQLRRITDKRALLRERIEIKERLEEKDQIKYYSSWYYSAIHILTTIPEFQTKSAIAERLGLGAETLNEALSFLSEVGLVRQEQNKLVPGLTRLFLGSNSPLVAKHHTNWRMRAIQSFDEEIENDLHYSVVVSIAEKDIATIKELFIKSIESARKIIRESKEEDLHCINLDFFRV